MIGLLIGVPAGALLFYLLTRFTKGLTGRGHPPLLSGLLFVILPPAVLLLTALVARESILWAGIGMTGVLVIGGVVFFAVSQTRGKASAPDSAEKEVDDR